LYHTFQLQNVNKLSHCRLQLYAIALKHFEETRDVTASFHIAGEIHHRIECDEDVTWQNYINVSRGRSAQIPSAISPWWL